MSQAWDLVAYISSLDEHAHPSRSIAELGRWCGHIESYEDPGYHEDVTATGGLRLTTPSHGRVLALKSFL